MSGYRNLICDTEQVQDAADFLRMNGGKARAIAVARHALNIPNLSEDIAVPLVKGFLRHDIRFSIKDDEVDFKDPFFPSRRLSESSYVVFDLETTGAKAPPCRITEIGAFKIEKGEIVDEFHTLVNPETEIPPFITELTGISDEMVENAPKFSEISRTFLDFIDDSVVVAHNAQFDMRFVNHEIGLVEEDHKLGNPHICTVQISRKLVRDVENHRLNTLARHFSIPLLNHHRAKDDALATAKIFTYLLDMLLEKGIDDIEAATRFNPNEAKIKTSN